MEMGFYFPGWMPMGMYEEKFITNITLALVAAFAIAVVAQSTDGQDDIDPSSPAGTDDGQFSGPVPTQHPSTEL
ncbi:hypothetical protein H4219_003441 [Mycoemilia scoparia]|uniref:Uncharacterized protein n=1 Tax=Mycoemilia scoparia TaxID=417184 RepID=A0A9W8DP91_9FUNG|nr:hypothetical protein H4219_003441 [Mycoemilia scoparia]